MPWSPWPISWTRCSGEAESVDPFFPAAKEIKEGGEERAHHPAQGIAEAHHGRSVDELCDNEQVDLPEQHIGKEHDEHGSPGIPGSPQRSGKDLCGAAGEGQGTVGTDEQGPITDHLWILVEHGHKLSGRKPEHRGHGDGDGRGHIKGRQGAPLGPGDVPGSDILAHEGGGCLVHALERQEDKLVDLRITAPSSHAGGAEIVDIGLDVHVGKAGKGLLETSGQADGKDLL